MSIFQAVTMPQDKIVSNSDGSLKPAWLSYFGQIERMSAALDAYVPPTPPAQKLAQVVSTETSAAATGTTALPWDDTIPQNTEGDQFLSLAVTPTSATSTLIINVVLTLAHNAVNPIVTVALFQDTTANALAAVGAFGPATADRQYQASLLHTMTAGTTSPTTFKVRVGANAGGTTTLNGATGTRRFGGVSASTLTITEVLA